jgi:uncharacterized protein (DUF1697 family)
MGKAGKTARRWVALARGINVGTAKRVSMGDLKAVVESLGHRDVVTVLNSGNVVFTAGGAGRASPAAVLERAIGAKVGFAVPVVALDGATVDAIVGGNPWTQPARDPSKLVVAALRDAAALARAREMAAEPWGRDQLACGRYAAYLWCPDGIAESKLVLAMNRVLRDDVTMRNWNTMLRLQALVRRT